MRAADWGKAISALCFAQGEEPHRSRKGSARDVGTVEWTGLGSVICNMQVRPDALVNLP
jgi:hypothetical protein